MKYHLLKLCLIFQEATLKIQDRYSHEPVILHVQELKNRKLKSARYCNALGPLIMKALGMAFLGASSLHVPEISGPGWTKFEPAPSCEVAEVLSMGASCFGMCMNLPVLRPFTYLLSFSQEIP